MIGKQFEDKKDNSINYINNKNGKTYEVIKTLKNGVTTYADYTYDQLNKLINK